MHHEDNYQSNDEDALHSNIEVDQFLKSLEACIVLEKWEYLEQSNYTHETVETGKTGQSDQLIDVLVGLLNIASARTLLGLPVKLHLEWV